MNKMNYTKRNNENMIVYYENSRKFSFKNKNFIIIYRLQFTESCGIALLDYQNKKASLEQRSTAVCYHIYIDNC